MFVSGSTIIALRRSDLEHKRASYVTAALEGGKSWDEAKAIGDEVVPPSEFEYLDELRVRHAHSTRYELPVVLGLLSLIAVGFISVAVWGAF